MSNAERENNYLRGVLAQSDLPCAHCQLSRDEWGKCVSGFPGCARADDLCLGEMALTRQARIDARTLELIEEATTEDCGADAFRLWDKVSGLVEACASTDDILRAALTEARRIATEEADADTTKEKGQ